MFVCFYMTGGKITLYDSTNQVVLKGWTIYLHNKNEQGLFGSQGERVGCERVGCERVGCERGCKGGEKYGGEMGVREWDVREGAKGEKSVREWGVKGEV